MRGKPIKAVAAVAILASLLLAAPVPGAEQPRFGQIKVRVGNLLITAGGSFSPTKLPKNVDAPVKLKGHIEIKNLTGGAPPPLRRVTILFDRHGHHENRGLPVCRPSRLANTVVVEARRACGSAIVGKGYGEAIVTFPDQKPIPAGSPVTVFNGPDRRGDPTVVFHAYSTIPVPTTFVIVSRIQKVNKGRYGYLVDTRIPPIAGGYGALVRGHGYVARKWTYRGKRLSLVNARCADGRLQAHGTFVFGDGTLLSGSAFRPCTVRE